MENIIFDTANLNDIPELIRMRIAFSEADLGTISDEDKHSMEAVLPDYYNRKLGKELMAFVARDGEKIVSTAYLLISEKPASPKFLNGLTGEVFSVYTEKEYRRRGISTQLLKNLLEFAKEKRLCRIDLSATSEGYPLYKKLGFTEKGQEYTDMRLKP